VQKEKKKLDATAVIHERNHAPVVDTCPERIVARRNDPVSWAITNAGSQRVTVMLAEFGDDPLEKTDRDRAVDVDPGETKRIHDKVKSDAAFKLYHYEIYLNGSPALDPEITIKDFPDVEP
jgi:hypothetical protein